MFSKRKSKCSVKNLPAALQIEIDPLVNKVRVHEYQNDSQSLIYAIYLNPQSSSYQLASQSHVFTSYLDPAISSKLHLPFNGFFQYFPYAPKLLTTRRLGEVSILAKYLSRMYRWRGRSKGKL